MTPLIRFVTLALGAATSFAVAACSSNSTPECGDAAVCNGACPASFTGNFTDDSSSAGNCAMLAAGSGSAAGDQLVNFSVASTVLGGDVAVTFDLGTAPSTGTYSSETVTNWSAVGVRPNGDGECAYVAGAVAVPTGSFTMSLTAFDATSNTAHGNFSITQYVQTPVQTDCGAGDNEVIAVTF